MKKKIFLTVEKEKKTEKEIKKKAGPKVEKTCKKSLV